MRFLGRPISMQISLVQLHDAGYNERTDAAAVRGRYTPLFPNNGASVTCLPPSNHKPRTSFSFSLLLRPFNSQLPLQSIDQSERELNDDGELIFLLFTRQRCLLVQSAARGRRGRSHLLLCRLNYSIQISN